MTTIMNLACGALSPVAVALALALTSTAAGAQDAAPPGMVPGEGGGEAEALVARIKETLGRIDESLFEVPYADDVGTALEDVRQQHLAAIRDIEELIKQAKYNKGKNSSSSGGGGGGGGGSSPQQQDQQPRESDGSQAPKPGEQQGGEQPQPGSGEEEKPQGEQPADGEQPSDGAPKSGDPGENRRGQRPPPDPLGDPIRENTDGRWGLLPPKVQEQLMNLHVDDVPVRYRAWLSAYVRALNAAEEEGGGR